MVLRGRAQIAGVARFGRSSHFNTFHIADVRKSLSVRQVMERVRPNVVIHAAAISRHEACEKDPLLAQEVNVEGTRNVAREADRIGARLVYISTDAVFDGHRASYTESDSPNPFSVYGETKLLGEHVAQEFAETLVIRTNFFGWSPTGNRSVLDFFVNNLEKFHEVPGYSDFTVASMYVDHLIESIWDLVQMSTTGIIHVTSSDALTKLAFGRQVAEVFGFDPKLVIPSRAPMLSGVVRGARNISLSPKRCEEILGRSMSTQNEGLRQAKHDQFERRVLRVESGQVPDCGPVRY